MAHGGEKRVRILNNRGSLAHDSGIPLGSIWGRTNVFKNHRSNGLSAGVLMSGGDVYPFEVFSVESFEWTSQGVGLSQ